MDGIVLKTRKRVVGALDHFVVLALRWTWSAIHSVLLRDVVCSALLWGLLLLIKPVFILFPVALLLIGWPRKTYAIVFVLCAYLLPGLWVVRNGIVRHYWGLSTQSGFDLLKYPAASVEAMRTGRAWEDVQRDLQTEVDAQDPLHQRGWIEKSEAYHARAKIILQAHPILLARYCALGAIRILGGTGGGVFLNFLSAEERPDPSWASQEKQTVSLMRQNLWMLPFQIVYVLALLAIYALAGWGWVTLWKSGERAGATFLAIGAIYLLAVASHQGYSRFRIPMMPFLAAAAAFARIKPGFPPRRA